MNLLAIVLTKNLLAQINKSKNESKFWIFNISFTTRYVIYWWKYGANAFWDLFFASKIHNAVWTTKHWKMEIEWTEKVNNPIVFLISFLL